MYVTVGSAATQVTTSINLVRGQRYCSSTVRHYHYVLVGINMGVIWGNDDFTNSEGDSDSFIFLFLHEEMMKVWLDLMNDQILQPKHGKTFHIYIFMNVFDLMYTKIIVFYTVILFLLLYFTKLR